MAGVHGQLVDESGQLTLTFDGASQPSEVITVMGRSVEAFVIDATITITGVGTNPGSVSATRLKEELAQLIQSQPAAKVDYIQFFDPLSLEPMEELRPGCHMALAVTIGKTRLIDNALI